MSESNFFKQTLIDEGLDPNEQEVIGTYSVEGRERDTSSQNVLQSSLIGIRNKKWTLEDEKKAKDKAESSGVEYKPIYKVGDGYFRSTLQSSSNQELAQTFDNPTFSQDLFYHDLMDHGHIMPKLVASGFEPILSASAEEERITDPSLTGRENGIKDYRDGLNRSIKRTKSSIRLNSETEDEYLRGELEKDYQKLQQLRDKKRMSIYSEREERQNPQIKNFLGLVGNAIQNKGLNLTVENIITQPIKDKRVIDAARRLSS